MNKTRICVALSVVMLGCNGVADSTSTRIEVGQANELGAVSIVIDHFEDHGNQVFELRGLDAAGNDVAVIDERIGDIADLPTYFRGSDNVGSEITFAARGHELRFLSREVQLFQFQPMDDSAIQGFAELSRVSAALAREGNIFVAPRATVGEQPYYTAASCPTSFMNVMPLATQCCWYQDLTCQPGAYCVRNSTTFVIPPNFMNAGAVSFRNQNTYGTTCKASDGVSSCLGKACFYGPNGFARPSLQVPAPGENWLIHNDTNPQLPGCDRHESTSPQTPYWPNVTGTIPNNGDCPGGVSGKGQWDDAF